MIGTLSGMTATVAVQPLDIVKVHIQLNMSKPKVMIVRNIYNGLMNESGASKPGLRNFYKGLDVALVRQSVYGTIRLGMFQDLKDNYKFNPMVAATVAASSATIANNPIDYVLVQKQTNAKYSLIKDFMASGGPNRVLFSGLKYNLLRAISINTGFGMKPYIEHRYVQTLPKLFSGNPNMVVTRKDEEKYLYMGKFLAIGTSSILSTMIALPFDTMRTLSQKQVPLKAEYFTPARMVSTYPTFAARVIPHSFIAMSCLDIYNGMYKKYLDNKVYIEAGVTTSGVVEIKEGEEERKTLVKKATLE